LIKSPYILAYFLIQKFLPLELISLPRFKSGFATKRPTTLKAYYELITILFGTLAADIYDLITLFLSVKTFDN